MLCMGNMWEFDLWYFFHVCRGLKQVRSGRRKIFVGYKWKFTFQTKPLWWFATVHVTVNSSCRDAQLYRSHHSNNNQSSMAVALVSPSIPLSVWTETPFVSTFQTTPSPLPSFPSQIPCRKAQHLLIFFLFPFEHLFLRLFLLDHRFRYILTGLIHFRIVPCLACSLIGFFLCHGCTLLLYACIAFLKKKNCFDHISTFYKLWMQTRTKRLKITGKLF